MLRKNKRFSPEASEVLNFPVFQNALNQLELSNPNATNYPVQLAFLNVDHEEKEFASVRIVTNHVKNSIISCSVILLSGQIRSY